MSEKIRILAVDDSSINLATIEQELKNKYEVITVNSGVRALRYLKTEKPDLILLDIQMALKDGIETLKDIRDMENGATIPVIMLTAKTDRESIIETTRLGIYDYIAKPFNSEDLHERITRTLKRAGVIPMEETQIYEDIRAVQRDVRAKNTSSAITKITAILNYQMDEEILGRMQATRAKLQAGDEETARRLLSRVLKILDNIVHPDKPPKLPISMEDTHKRLHSILDALESFKVREASEMVKDLLLYDLSPGVTDACEEAMECLEEFDDGAAEELIKDALEKLEASIR